MKTRVVNFAKKLDETIPDATPELFKETAANMGKNTKATLKCAGCTAICAVTTTIGAYAVLEDSVVLGLACIKTGAKKTFEVIDEFYKTTNELCIRR